MQLKHLMDLKNADYHNVSCRMKRCTEMKCVILLLTKVSVAFETFN